MKINLISLGCPKNLVDSETLAGLLSRKHTFTPEAAGADAIILNTCAFIGSARREAVKYIKKITAGKSRGQVFIVCGCLPQLEKQNLLARYPGIDFIAGSADYVLIPSLLDKKTRESFVGKPCFISDSSYGRIISTAGYAYLKIGEGCDNRCSYCLIPSLRGAYRERKIEDITAEAEKIVDSGRREIILVSQDTTFYGKKIYGRSMLHKLLYELDKIKNLQWIRLLYTHPGHFTDEIIEAIAGLDRVAKYVDMPVQHTDDDMLSAMGRPPARYIYSAVDRLRRKAEGLALRTTVMVGFPGENKKNFERLLADVKVLEFDWLGCFEYSGQKGTKASGLGGAVSADEKKKRREKIMSAQQAVTLARNRKYAGKVYTVMVDSGVAGHAEFQAPEIDGKIIFETPPRLSPGEITRVKISGIKGIYDLKGIVLGLIFIILIL